MRQGNPDAARALNIYAHRVKHYIGAYIADLNGVDLVVFTGGIGETMIWCANYVFATLKGLALNSIILRIMGLPVPTPLFPNHSQRLK